VTRYGRTDKADKGQTKLGGQIKSSAGMHMKTAVEETVGLLQSCSCVTSFGSLVSCKIESSQLEKQPVGHRIEFLYWVLLD
jgi:hypothetical protein